MAGRPPKFNTPEELQQAFYDYQNEFQPGGSLVDEIPDVESFCYYIGSYRQLLMEYDAREAFSTTVKEIRGWLMYRKKQLAMSGKMNATVFIFDAKNNAGYVDQTLQDLTSGGEKIGVGLSDTQAEQLIAARASRKQTDS